MNPYYEEGGITIYCGDCRFLGWLSAESIISDPIWPNSVFKDVHPQELLAQALANGQFPGVERVVIHLGCDSDPRFLEAVPRRWPFLRVCWLDYAWPSCKGRILYGSDVAYVFGVPPAPRDGHFLLPGKCMAQRNGYNVQREIGGPTAKQKNFSRRLVDSSRGHPCPRRIQHVRWLVNHFAGASVLDPFAGSGTTAVACKALGVPCTLIEIEERYCELAANRLRQSVLELVDSAPAR